MKHYDVIVIGAGPGGYVAAIRCAQLGLRTACVDRWLDSKGKPALGGTCLNVGCIPSKALLDSSHHYHNALHLLPAHGVRVGDVQVDLPAMLARKDKVVQTLTRGIGALFRKNKISTHAGSARLLPGREVEVSPHQGEPERLSADSIIVATGSVPVDIPVAPVDGNRIVDNVGALAFSKVPGRLGVIGAGVIGLELGSVWNRLGAEVVLLEALDEFLPPVDRQIAAEAQKLFRRQKLDLRLGARVTRATSDDDGVTVSFETADGAQEQRFDRLVVAVGRRPCTEGLGAAEAGLELDAAGRIVVDERCRTAIEGVYAVGDAVRGPMLAHKASEEGVAVAEQIAGEAPEIDHSLVPWVIYTHPEIAWVGRTEHALREAGVEFRSGTFPFMASGRAQGAGETQGLVKVIGEADTDRLLGVHILGPQASELIAEAVTAMAFHASTEDIARIVHAHPTLSEATHEAALAAHGRAIHI